MVRANEPLPPAGRGWDGGAPARPDAQADTDPVSGSIHVPHELLAAMRAHAAETYPEECCGGLLGSSAADGDGDSHVVRCVAAPNARSDERERRYLIGPELVGTFEREAEASGLELIGFYHSHPDHPARPSVFDRDHAWPWYAYIIVPVDRGEANAPRAWRLRDDREDFDELGIESESRNALANRESRVSSPSSRDSGPSNSTRGA